DLARILADAQLAEPPHRSHRRRALDDRPYHLRRRVDLADPGDPGVGRDSDQRGVLTPVPRVARDSFERFSEHDRLYVRDLHRDSRRYMTSPPETFTVNPV